MEDKMEKNLIKWLYITDRYSKMFLDKELEPLGLNSSQHMYIMEICKNPGITQDNFLKIFYINPSNVTRAISHLEKEGFIKRESSTQDKRTCHLYPTKKAEAAYHRIIDIRNDWYKIALKDFSPEDKERFHYFMETVGNHFIDRLSPATTIRGKKGKTKND